VTDFGTVKPKTVVEVVPQVSGIVVECHSDFVNGGFFKAGQALITIDQRDYQAAVNNAEAVVARARLKLDQELEEASIAKAEWQDMNPGKDPASALVLREPQIAQAKAELKSTEASLDTAKLNLDRTVISMPFNGRIAKESVDLGQYITPGKPIATVYGTDAAEIVVPLQDKDLVWFDVPNSHGGEKNTVRKNGSQVDVTAEFAGQEWTWTGKVVRTQGSIDPVSRMLNVVVEVKDPFAKQGQRPALMPGMFVSIEIKGKTLKDVIKLPRHVVHNYDKVWLADESKLIIKTVTIVRNDRKYSYITEGITDGDIIVTSPIDVVTDGMSIRTETTTENKVQDADENGK
jgi:RND family efflux transporter MFP subunit